MRQQPELLLHDLSIPHFITAGSAEHVTKNFNAVMWSSSKQVADILFLSYYLSYVVAERPVQDSKL